MDGIQIYELRRMDLRGATVIDGFPSVGLVSSIVANYLINALNLVQIGIMDSVQFPTVSLVRDGEPMNPVRIYGGPKKEANVQRAIELSMEKYCSVNIMLKRAGVEVTTSYRIEPA